MIIKVITKKRNKLIKTSKDNYIYKLLVIFIIHKHILNIFLTYS